MSSSRILACLAVAALTHSSVAATAGGRASQLALVGIKAVAVLIEALPPGANLINLTKDQIQTDVELAKAASGRLACREHR
jgi:hypothetical protein